MVGIYFSGTGNTEYCVKSFFERHAPDTEIYSIENPLALEKINVNEEILFAYPIQFSNLPKIVHDHIIDNKDIWTAFIFRKQNEKILKQAENRPRKMYWMWKVRCKLSNEEYRN